MGGNNYSGTRECPKCGKIAPYDPGLSEQGNAQLYRSWQQGHDFRCPRK
jgi:hypothetical protein